MFADAYALIGAKKPAKKKLEDLTIVADPVSLGQRLARQWGLVVAGSDADLDRDPEDREKNPGAPVFPLRAASVYPGARILTLVDGTVPEPRLNEYIQAYHAADCVPVTEEDLL